MRGLIAIIGFVAIAGGLVVLAYSDPVLKVIVYGTSSIEPSGLASFTRTASFTFTRTATSFTGFPGFGGGNFTFTGVPAGARGAGLTAVTNTTTELETLTGFAIIAVGLVVAAIGASLITRAEAAPKEAPPAK